MTRVRDVMSAECIFSQNAKQARVPHHPRARLSHNAMIIMFGLIEIFSQG